VALIKHIAIATDDPKRLAEYYADVFGLTITGHGSHGDYWLTDGYMDFALIPHFADSPYPTGVSHFGFTLQDEAEKAVVAEKMAKYGLGMKKPPVDRPYVEEKGKDIDGNTFDIATSAVAQSNEMGRVKEKAVRRAKV
jgi:catechol 2,3-dioxygenase-like lactoylglutathione lyase family enzyme